MLNSYSLNQAPLNDQGAEAAGSGTVIFADVITLTDVVDGVTVFNTNSFENSMEVTDDMFVSYSSLVNPVFLSDTFSLTQETVVSSQITISDSFAVSSTIAALLVQYQVELSDTITFQDAVSARIFNELSDTFAISDSIEIGKVLEILIDSLGLTDSFNAISQSIQSVASVFGLTDSLGRNFRLEFTDAILFADSILEQTRQLKQITDTITLTDSYSATFLVEAQISDDFAVSDTLAETIQRILAISDTIAFSGVISFAGQAYLVWAMNPKTSAVFELAYGKSWNSFAKVGGKNLLCCADGVYEVDGKDDDGTDIEAFLRTGLVDFDDPERHYPGEKLKQLLNAYLVLTTDGQTLLKVRTTRRGTMVETWFKCVETPAATSKVQIPLSNSLRSILFQFEIKPLDGASLRLSQAEIIPLFLSRSI